tara:strand:- start:3122 stop:3991 length:870 start_codon:yes stop_codon:yes gene_type:complete
MNSQKRNAQFISKETYRKFRKAKKFIYLEDLKKTSKQNGLKIKSLKKKQLLELLDNYYNESIQKLVNNEDFYTLETLDSIDKDYLFIIDDSGYKYGFDIRSFKKLIDGTKENPYNRNIFSSKIIDSYNKRCEDLKIKKKGILFDQDNINLTCEQLHKQKILNIFQKIDALDVIASGTRISWFNELNMNQLKKLYGVMEDVWNYRSQLTQEQKIKIVPDNNLFLHSKEYIHLINDENKKSLENIILDNMDKLISSGITIDEKKTGCYYILISLSEVNVKVVEDCPWLIQY